MSKLDKIQNKLSHVNADVVALRGENASINSRLNEIEASCQSLSDIADDYYSHKINTSKHYLNSHLKQIKENSKWQHSKYKHTDPGQYN